MNRDATWIAVLVLPVVLLYGGAFYLVGGFFARHVGDQQRLIDCDSLNSSGC